MSQSDPTTPWRAGLDLDLSELSTLLRDLGEAPQGLAPAPHQGEINAVFFYRSKGARRVLRVLRRGPRALHCELAAAELRSPRIGSAKILRVLPQVTAHRLPALIQEQLEGEPLDPARGLPRSPPLEGVFAELARPLALAPARFGPRGQPRPWPEPPFSFKLRRWLHEEKAQGRLGEGLCQELFARVPRWEAEIQAAALGASLSHGDLRPEHVWLGPEGDVSILDWEWARLDHPCYDSAVFLTFLLPELRPALEASLCQALAHVLEAPPEALARQIEIQEFLVRVEALKVDLYGPSEWAAHQDWIERFLAREG